ncbi:MAG TPA: hypothetical protein DEB46_14390, partial [Myxococcales bacterium]|nr:hypothetical protein [Myxococcales bacterium]
MARHIVFSMMTLPLLVACPESDHRPMVTDAGPERRDQLCLEGQFQCAGDSTCIPEAWVCDGQNDCAGGDDEPADCLPPGADAGPDGGQDAGTGHDDDAGNGGDGDAGSGGGNDAGVGGDDAGAGGG